MSAKLRSPGPRGGPRPRVRRIRLAGVLRPGSAFHVARTVVGESGLAGGEHDHDFPELFWIESGRGTHTVNGRSREVGPGFVSALRPPDRHTFRAAPGEALAVMNVAFPRECLELWRRRYAPQCAAIFPERAALPWSTELEESGLRWLAQAARELAAGQGSLLVLDRFFIEVFLRLAPGGPGREPVPEWLRAALAALRSPESFRRGPAGLAELAGRSPEHVNRTLRRCLGVTATEAFNAARLGWAADELRFTERPILEVGLGAGFAGLSHFYALFRARFGATPRAWRRRHRELAARVL